MHDLHDCQSTVPTVIFLHHDKKGVVIDSIGLIRMQGIAVTDLSICYKGDYRRKLEDLWDKLTRLISPNTKQLLFVSRCPGNAVNTLIVAKWAKSLNDEISIFVFDSPGEWSLMTGLDATIIDGIISDVDPAPTSVSSYITRLFLAGYPREQLKAVALRVQSFQMFAIEPRVCY